MLSKTHSALSRRFCWPNTAFLEAVAISSLRIDLLMRIASGTTGDLHKWCDQVVGGKTKFWDVRISVHRNGVWLRLTTLVQSGRPGGSKERN